MPVDGEGNPISDTVVAPSIAHTIGYEETKVPVIEQGKKVGDISTASHYMYAGGQYLGELTEHGQIRVKQQHFKGLDVIKSDSNRVHEVQEGETLRSIAQLQYGNGNFWFIIADANSLTSDPDEGLTVGQSLTIPQQNNNQNSFDTLLPMNLAELIGDTTPSLGYLPPPSEAGCNAVASIIMIAVAVAVSAGAGGALIGSSSSLFASGGSLTALGAATAAAAGSVASQVAGMALGEVDNFSWKQVAISAITAGATKGLGDKLKLDQIGANVAHDIARGAISYGAGHVANKLLGQQTSFSWSNLAASSLGYAAGAQVGTTLAQEIGVDFSTDFGSQLTSELTSGVADLHIGRALGENTKVDYGQIGLDAFGNAIGNTIAGRMERARQQEQQRLAQINQQHSQSSQRLQNNAAQDLNNSIAGTARRIVGEANTLTNELVTQQGLSNNNELSTLFQGERGQKIQDNFYRSAQEARTRTNNAIHAANLAGERIRLEGQQFNAVRQNTRDAEIARVQTQFDDLGGAGYIPQTPDTNFISNSSTNYKQMIGYLGAGVEVSGRVGEYFLAKSSLKDAKLTGELIAGGPNGKLNMYQRDLLKGAETLEEATKIFTENSKSGRAIRDVANSPALRMVKGVPVVGTVIGAGTIPLSYMSAENNNEWRDTTAATASVVGGIAAPAVVGGALVLAAASAPVVAVAGIGAAIGYGFFGGSDFVDSTVREIYDDIRNWYNKD